MPQRKPTEEENQQFMMSLGMLALTLGMELKEDRVKAYCRVLLEDFSPAELDVACTAFGKDPGRKFFPTVPEFYGKMQGDPKAKAANSFSIMVRAMQDAGSYESVSFQDRALMATIDAMGGWIECCHSNRELKDEAYSYWTHRFQEVYVRKLQENRPVPLYFPGLFEKSNALGAGERGKLPEPQVISFSNEGRMDKVPLLSLSPLAPLALAWARQEGKQLTDGGPVTEDEITSVVKDALDKMGKPEGS